MVCVLILSLLAYVFGVNYFQENKLIIPSTINEYNDVVVKLHDQNLIKSKTFEKALVSSLALWKAEGRKTVWLTLPLDRGDLIPIALRHNFVCHHAAKKEILLTHLLIPGMENTIPHYATRSIGVCGLVLDDNNNVLVVKDRYKPETGFKLPGGGVDPSEDLWKGAIREVKEETGIDTEFIGIIAWREQQNLRWECSDIYFCCLLKPLNFDICQQESEISECRWLPFEEFKMIAQEDHLQFLLAYEKNGAPYKYKQFDEIKTLYACQ